MTSNLNLGDAAKKLNDPTLGLPSLQGKVSASAETGTQLVRVAAEDPSPQRAALIANAVAETFVNYVEKAQLAGQTSSTSNLNTVFVAETAEASRSPGGYRYLPVEHRREHLRPLLIVCFQRGCRRAR